MIYLEVKEKKKMVINQMKKLILINYWEMLLSLKLIMKKTETIKTLMTMMTVRVHILISINLYRVWIFNLQTIAK